MPTLRDYAHLHFVVLIWGFTVILGKLISVPSVELVFWRTLLATLLCGGFLYFKKIDFLKNIPKKDVIKLLLTGALICAHWILFFGAGKLNASVCLAGLTTATLWTSLVEPFVQKRQIRGLEIVLGFVVIFGLYIIFRFEFNHILALVMSILSAFFGTLFSVINGEFIKKHSHHTITFYEMLGAWIATVLFLPFYAYFFAPNYTLHLLPDTQNMMLDIVCIFTLAGVCTVYAYSAGVKLMKKFTPFAVNLTVNLEPVYGIVLAYYFFNEKMTSGFYLGTLIILSAVLAYPFLKYYTEKIYRQNLHNSWEKRKKKEKKGLIQPKKALSN
jgi:drug/metabolite transporter (DMT)-like permease